MKRAWQLLPQKNMYKNIEAEVHRQKAEVKFIDFMVAGGEISLWGD
ncbi:hypothetical protein [Thermophagus xiamenensis]|nr:hypothetical protein [Thermophagus xiamenensis]